MSVLCRKFNILTLHLYFIPDLSLCKRSRFLLCQIIVLQFFVFLSRALQDCSLLSVTEVGQKAALCTVKSEYQCDNRNEALKRIWMTPESLLESSYFYLVCNKSQADTVSQTKVIKPIVPCAQCGVSCLLDEVMFHIFIVHLWPSLYNDSWWIY